jgi:uncharacterized YccA/Bax inhibitor family protein
MALSKIPYTDNGIAEVENEIRAVYERGVNAGHFEADSLVMDVPRSADISAATKATRELTINGTVTKAGAVKNVTLNFALIF